MTEHRNKALEIWKKFLKNKNSETMTIDEAISLHFDNIEQALNKSWDAGYDSGVFDLHQESFYKKVEEFHIKFNIPINSHLNIYDREFKKYAQIRSEILKSEVEEYDEAVKYSNPLDVFDAIIDQMYVLYGTAISCGISLDQLTKGFEEVHQSNMSKDTAVDGGNKPIKGENYIKPNLVPILMCEFKLVVECAGCNSEVGRVMCGATDHTTVEHDRNEYFCEIGTCSTCSAEMDGGTF